MSFFFFFYLLPLLLLFACESFSKRPMKRIVQESRMSFCAVIVYVLRRPSVRCPLLVFLDFAF